MVRILTAEVLDLTFLALESHQASAVEEVPSVADVAEAASATVTVEPGQVLTVDLPITPPPAPLQHLLPSRFSE